ncbi:MAG: 30S ribosomal protein S6 [Flavobacteriales bacterium]|nr:30S ribosomal protein S6 [Flavobacteriales bacterium]MCB9448840.1 30S ribosomal protein S6 [Flavobacteriales bacterium]
MSEIKNRYETVFIMTPVLSDEQLKETVSKIKNLLKDEGAEVIHERKWGLRKLAYPIQKKSTGFYHLLEYAAPGTAIDALEVELKRDERVLRFLTVKLDKHAVAYNERKRDKSSKKSEDVKPQPEEA